MLRIYKSRSVCFMNINKYAYIFVLWLLLGVSVPVLSAHLKRQTFEDERMQEAIKKGNVGEIETQLGCVDYNNPRKRRAFLKGATGKFRWNVMGAFAPRILTQILRIVFFDPFSVFAEKKSPIFALLSLLFTWPFNFIVNAFIRSFIRWVSGSSGQQGDIAVWLMLLFRGLMVLIYLSSFVLPYCKTSYITDMLASNIDKKKKEELFYKFKGVIAQCDEKINAGEVCGLVLGQHAAKRLAYIAWMEKQNGDYEFQDLPLTRWIQSQAQIMFIRLFCHCTDLEFQYGSVNAFSRKAGIPLSNDDRDTIISHKDKAIISSDEFIRKYTKKEQNQAMPEKKELLHIFFCGNLPIERSNSLEYLKKYYAKFSAWCFPEKKEEVAPSIHPSPAPLQMEKKGNEGSIRGVGVAKKKRVFSLFESSFFWLSFCVILMLMVILWFFYRGKKRTG